MAALLLFSIMASKCGEIHSMVWRPAVMTVARYDRRHNCVGDLVLEFPTFGMDIHCGTECNSAITGDEIAFQIGCCAAKTTQYSDSHISLLAR